MIKAERITHKSSDKLIKYYGLYTRVCVSTFFINHETKSPTKHTFNPTTKLGTLYHIKHLDTELRAGYLVQSRARKPT